MMSKNISKVVMAMAAVLLLAACGKKTEESIPSVSENEEPVVVTEEKKSIVVPEDREWTVSENLVVKLSGFAQLEEYDEETATIISVHGDQVEITGEGAICEGRRIIIGQEGCYVVRGESDNARIVVDAEGAKVQLVLDNVQLTAGDGAVIYGKEAKKISITCPAGTENTLTDYVFYSDDKEKAAIYATCDLYLNGTGTLRIKGNYKHGIATKDDLKIYHVTLDVDASEHALKGTDSILVVESNVTLYAGTDGCHVKNEEDENKGTLVVLDSYLYVTAEDDCLQVPQAIILQGSEVICRCYDKIVNCDGYLEGTDDIKVWR